MTTLIQLHQEHAGLESDIRFYSLEINFLLKILTREYAHKASIAKIKTLDSYWKEFEKYGLRLIELSNEIKKEEKRISEMYANNIYRYEKTEIEEHLISEFTALVDELKLLKQSLYDYLENNPS